MVSKSSTVRFLFAVSALSLGFAAWSCGGSSKTAFEEPAGDNPGGESPGGASSQGGSAQGGVPVGGTGNGGKGNGGTTTVIGGTGGASGASGTAGTSGSGGSATGTTQCTNGLDDDGDGRIDGEDPECTGPLDDDESSFGTGIPGDNRDPKWQDCFFDGNSGAGDDRCRYATGCLTGELDQDDPDCELSQACIDFCRRLTPNGCDCFGCCTVRDVDGSEVNVMLGGACSVASLHDENLCHSCVKTTSDCGNTCGECELCPGKTISDLPAHCSDMPDGGPGTGGTGSGGSGNAGTGNGGTGGTPPPPNTCDNGEQVCSADIPCLGSYYCSFGCCLPVVR